MLESAINCTAFDKRAVFVVEFYGPKGNGPKDAQNFISDVMCRIGELKGSHQCQRPKLHCSRRNSLLLRDESAFGLRYSNRIKLIKQTSVCQDLGKPPPRKTPPLKMFF